MSKYYVLNENTLGYIQDERPDWFCILHGSVLKGGLDSLKGSHPLTSLDVLRPATKADFDEYNVSWHGHLPE